MCGADRFGGDECLRLGIVDSVRPSEQVVSAAADLAKHYAPKGANKPVKFSLVKFIFWHF